MKNLLRIAEFGLAAYGGYILVNKAATWYWDKYGDDIKRQVRSYVIDQVYDMVKDANDNSCNGTSSANKNDLTFRFNNMGAVYSFVKQINDGDIRAISIGEILDVYSTMMNKPSTSKFDDYKFGFKNGVTYSVAKDQSGYLFKILDEPCIL